MRDYLVAVGLHTAPFPPVEHALGSVTMLLLGVPVGPRNSSESTDKGKM